MQIMHQYLKTNSHKLPLSFTDNVANHLYTKQADIHLSSVSSHISGPVIHHKSFVHTVHLPRESYRLKSFLNFCSCYRNEAIIIPNLGHYAF